MIMMPTIFWQALNGITCYVVWKLDSIAVSLFVNNETAMLSGGNLYDDIKTFVKI